MTTIAHSPAAVAAAGTDAPAAVRETAALRRQIVDALHASGGGHYGGSLSVVDVLWTLYTRVIQTADRVILSKGHAAMALYAVLHRLGRADAPLASYAAAGSPYEGHPDMTTLPAVGFSTGSLGQGLSAAVGMALALRQSDATLWAVVGDGECQEGQVWEAAMLAARLRLDALHVIVDANGHQEFGWPGGDAPEPVPDLAAKWSAFGWQTFCVDGHDHAALEETLHAARRSCGRPCAIIARTVKGKGYALFEADAPRFHCGVLSPMEYASLASAPR